MQPGGPADTRRVVISGATGYIGRKVTDSFLDRGLQVRVLSRQGATPIIPEPCETLRVDLLDTSSVEGAIRDAEIVVHLAGVGSPASPTELFQNIITTNLLGTQSILTAAVATGVRRVVLASSSAVYGRAGAALLREDMPVMPLSVYGVSKFAMERLGAAFTATGDVEIVSLRVFNVYGPGQSIASQRHLLIPHVIRRMLAQQPIVIRGDGLQTRDFVHVDDVVDAFLRAGLQIGLPERVINVGTGVPSTVRGIVDAIAARIGVQPVIERQDIRPGEIRHAIADVSHLASNLGITPRQRVEEFLRNLATEELEQFRE